MRAKTFLLSAAGLVALGAVGSVTPVPAPLVPAWAQNAVCPDRPTGDSTNACANTRFVSGATGGSIALAAGRIFVGNASNIATAVLMSQDCTMAQSGVITCTRTNNTLFGALATTSPIASGVTTALGIAPNAAGGFVTQGTTQITFTVASGTQVFGTTAIASATCTSIFTSGATGVASTDTVHITPNTDIAVVTGFTPATAGSLSVYFWPITNGVQWRSCNPTAATLTPASFTMNYRVTR